MELSWNLPTNTRVSFSRVSKGDQDGDRVVAVMESGKDVVAGCTIWSWKAELEAATSFQLPDLKTFQVWESCVKRWLRDALGG